MDLPTRQAAGQYCSTPSPMTEAALDDDRWLRGAVERAVAGILVVQGGRIVYANPHAARMLERSRETLTGLAPTALLGEAQRAQHLNAVDSLLSGAEDTTQREYRVELPSGARRQIAVSSTRIDFHGRPAVLGVLHDVTAHRESEAALRASEEKYRSMVVTLNEGVLIFDAVGGVTGANPSAERLLGRTLAQMRTTGLSDWRPLAADGQPMPVEALPLTHTLATGEPRRDVLMGDVSPAGATVWLNVNVEPLRGASGGAVVSFTDITERRRVEEALIGSEATNRMLMDALSDGVFVAQDFRFVFANPALPAMLGYRHDEFVGLHFDSVIAPEHLELWTQRFKGRVGSGTQPVRSYEVRFLRKDGAGIDLELVANRTRYLGRPAVLGVLRNITERKQVAAELERHRDHLEELVRERTQALEQAVAARLESETFAQTITDHQPTLLAYLDRELRVQFANRAYLSWFGQERAELLGRRVPQVLGQMLTEAADALGVAADMIGSGGRVGHFWIYRLPDLRDGQVRGYYFIATDITEVKAAEQRLQTLNDELLEARDKAEDAARAKSSFLANMSHEIRTPMNAIIGLTHLLQREVPEGPSRERLGKVAQAAQHLLDIVNDILDLSKIDAGKFELEQIDFGVEALLSNS